MAVLLNLFFNEYGLRSGMAWALSTIILFIICAIFMGFYMINHDVEDDFHPTFILGGLFVVYLFCLLYTSPSPRDVEESRMPSSA